MARQHTCQNLVLEDGVGLNLMTAIFNSIYQPGKIPSEWLK